MPNSPNWSARFTALPPVVVGLLLAVATLLCFPLLLMLGYNLAAPLFHAPSMTYGEAFGVALLIEMAVGLVVALKE